MASFTPPSASAGQCKGVPFDKAINTAAENKAAFDAFDQSAADRTDPSKCKALLAFPDDAAIFWSSKMAIDADGPAAGPGRPSGSKLDTGSGQDDTSLHFSNGKGLPSETIPYIVLPGGSFRANTGLALGDVAVVIFGDKITAAICGDMGLQKRSAKGPSACTKRSIRRLLIRVSVTAAAFADASTTSALMKTSCISSSPVLRSMGSRRRPWKAGSKSALFPCSTNCAASPNLFA
jgi:hypothetical protein